VPRRCHTTREAAATQPAKPLPVQSKGWWGGLTGREVDGRLQLAFGATRLLVLKEIFPGTKELEFEVEDLTDAQMIQWMSRENSAKRGGMAALLESVCATVEAFAAGLIPLKAMPVEGKTNKQYVRYAPSFQQPTSNEPSGATDVPHPYTAISIRFAFWSVVRILILSLSCLFTVNRQLKNRRQQTILLWPKRPEQENKLLVSYCGTMVFFLVAGFSRDQDYLLPALQRNVHIAVFAQYRLSR
jgi:hypothetical protein